MFASTVILAIAAVALAVPGAAAESSQCDASSIKCCDILKKSNEADTVPSLLGLVLNPDTFIGMECNPLPIIGTGSGANCAQQPVCCTDVDQTGLVNFGCSPVNVVV